MAVCSTLAEPSYQRLTVGVVRCSHSGVVRGVSGVRQCVVHIVGNNSIYILSYPFLSIPSPSRINVISTQYSVPSPASQQAVYVT